MKKIFRAQFCNSTIFLAIISYGIILVLDDPNLAPFISEYRPLINVIFYSIYAFLFFVTIQKIIIDTKSIYIDDVINEALKQELNTEFKLNKLEIWKSVKPPNT